VAELVAGGLGPAWGGRTRGLVGSLRALIVDGRLLDGDRLPAERLLAVELGVSRSTVTAAYDQLRGEGYLVGRRGSGTFVATPAVTRSGRPDDDREAEADLLDLTVAVLPALPALADAAVEAAAGLPAHLSRAGLDPAGLPELRAEVAARYTDRGVPTGPDQILVTSGALHGWDLLLRTFARPSALVVTEQPTYPGVIDAALAHRVRLRPLTVDRDGWHPEDLEGAGSAVLAHVTFDGQNPTGLCAGAATRRRVLAAFGAQTIVVVDETMIDYAEPPAGRPNPRNVVSVGSASKSFWAGLRIGWIRGPASLIRRVAAVRAGQDLAPPVMDQMMTASLLRQVDRLVPERRALVDERRRALLAAIERHCPDWTVVPPVGGLSVWIDLGGGSSTQLAVNARQLGIRVTPGTRFTHHGTHDQWLRLPCVLPAERVDEAVRTLARAAGNLSPARPHRHSTAAAAWTA
jgi:DNA-binding transcriptional MocR family regulator